MKKSFAKNKRSRTGMALTVNEMLEIPPSLSGDMFKLTVVGSGDVLVQNFDRIYEYTSSCVAFITGELLCEIYGVDLSMHGMNVYSVRVSGVIYDIKYSGGKK